MTFIAMPNAPTFKEAQCAGFAFPDLFFPDTLQELRDVKPMIAMTCKLCVHQVDCLAFAMDNNIKEGIWGGLTSDERKELKAKQERASRREQRKLDRILTRTQPNPVRN
jgi:WhiB family redox-sensing transcriptional regulator